jgi:membrane protease YdiL (CAAX protease family)
MNQSTDMKATEPSRQPEPKPYPGMAQSLLMLILFFLFTVLLSIPAFALTSLKFHRLGSWAMLLGQLGGTALTLKVCLPKGQKTWSDAFPSHSVPVGLWPALLVAMAGVVLLFNGLDAWVSHLIPPPASYLQMFTEAGWPVVVLGAPLAEEPLFRGLMLGGFVLRYGTRKAILYTALMFGLIHMNPWQFPSALLSGLLLGWLTLRTGSLWPAIFAHFLNNLSVTLSHALHLPYLSDGRYQPVWMWLLGFLLLGLGLAALAKWTAPSEPLDALPPDGETRARLHGGGPAARGTLRSFLALPR